MSIISAASSLIINALHCANRIEFQMQCKKAKAF